MGDNVDGCLILEFNTEQEASQALLVINQIALGWWQSQGYDIVGGQLVGKNALTGISEPLSEKTSAWDVVKASPDGTFYFTSPTPDPRFYLWRDYLPEGVVLPDDKNMPSSWNEAQ